MFGILDRLYKFKKSLEGKIEISFSKEPIIFGNLNNKEIWFYFIPRALFKYGFLSENFFINNRTIYAYVSDVAMLLKENPKQTNILLNEIYQNACGNIEARLKSGQKINFLGVSLGNVLAIRSAASYPCEKLVSISGGARLGTCAWDGILTRELAKNSGLSKEQYEQTLSEFDPIRYVPNVLANEIFVYIGSRDIIINSTYGKDLSNSFLHNHKNVKSRIYKYAYHCSSIYFSSRDQFKRHQDFS